VGAARMVAINRCLSPVFAHWSIFVNSVVRSTSSEVRVLSLGKLEGQNEVLDFDCSNSEDAASRALLMRSVA
jgi:hypothetical protein